jgi:hypothetical protein
MDSSFLPEIFGFVCLLITVYPPSSSCPSEAPFLHRLGAAEFCVFIIQRGVVEIRTACLALLFIEVAGQVLGDEARVRFPWCCSFSLILSRLVRRAASLNPAINLILLELP